MKCVWVHGCDPGREPDGSRLALYQTLSIEYPSIFFWHDNVLCVIVPFFFLLSLELFVHVHLFFFLSNRPRTGLAITYIYILRKI